MNTRELQNIIRKSYKSGYISVNGENILTTSNNDTLYDYFVKCAWC